MTSFNVLQNNLEELSLFKMKEILPNVIEKSVKSNTALQDSLIELTGAEIAFRDERARKINITVSHFPYIKTVKDFDFSYQPTINREQIMDFLSLRFIEQKSNIIFVGSSGVGKTHLAMAFGRECCLKGFKTYFLKASELNLKFTDARKNGREATVINGLVKPSCLIIDEVGRCVFDKANTRLFFDMIDRRYNKDGPCTMIFTSNKSPAQWREFFSEDDTLLCSLDRIFDDATVFMMKGDSYRGKKLETLGIEAGIAKHTEYKNT